MKNRELVKAILLELENKHLNLYHSVTKKEVLKFIDGIDNMDYLNDVEFDSMMRKMFSLFKDGHTTYFVPTLYVDKQLVYIGDKLYINDKDRYKEVIYVGNKKSEEFVNELGQLMNYETKEHLVESIREGLNNGYFYKMVNVEDNNSVTIEYLDNGINKKQKMNIISKEEAKEKGLISPLKYYSFKVLDNNVLYFKYERCQEDPNYSFQTLIEDLNKSKQKYGYTKYIFDLRGNAGGNSHILEPFTNFVSDNHLEGVLLIDNGVFSSGRIAVAEFREKFNTPIIGEPSGAALKSYGYNNNFKVEDKRFSVSIRSWDFSKPFGYEGAIQPDIYVPLTIHDIENHKDPQLEKAIEVILSKEKDITKISKNK